MMQTEIESEQAREAETDAGERTSEVPPTSSHLSFSNLVSQPNGDCTSPANILLVLAECEVAASSRHDSPLLRPPSSLLLPDYSALAVVESGARRLQLDLVASARDCSRGIKCQGGRA